MGKLLRRENGVPLSYVGMFADITDRKKEQENSDNQERKI
ncbi:MAG: hypothetical protein K6F53_01790 [Lachnospiraceae bacterium]|nr:hypothetical protein [Lachnospiraceae bacterium]